MASAGRPQDFGSDLPTGSGRSQGSLHSCSYLGKVQQVMLGSPSFRKHIELFHLVLTHPGSESCTVCFFRFLIH